MIQLGIIVGPHGRGSNMRAIVEACLAGEIEAQVAIVVGPNPDAPAFAVATQLGVPVLGVPYEHADTYGARLVAALSGVDVVCLAGYMRMIPPAVLHAFPNRILNIHPALLPEFGGKGMYGMHVHEAVVAAGKTESGCTVHLVTERYDEGQVLVQYRVDLAPGDTPEIVARKVLEQEHLAYPEALRRVVQELQNTHE